MKTKMKEIPPIPGINKTGRPGSIIDKIMKNIFSVLLLGLASLMAFTPQSGNAQTFNEKLGTAALQSNTTGSYNVALGDYSLPANTTGTSNTATGAAALFYNTTGNENTASGTTSLFHNTTGSSNTASGVNALLNNTTGNENTASGVNTLRFNTTGYSNTASGVRALYQNTEGFYNTASGFRSLFSNHTGNYNTASGVNALWANSTGGYNTASGFEALYFNNGGYNTANGVHALYSNTNGFSNTASGAGALQNNTTGGNNTAIGDFALISNTIGAFNIALGDYAGAAIITGSHNIDIGHQGEATGESNTIRIGTTGTQIASYMAGIYGSVAQDGTPVYVNSAGRLGTGPSSRRFKKDIADMGTASEALLALRPVTFHYKEEFDRQGIPQFGLVAEEVAGICPDLVLRDGKGEIYSVRYEVVNAMLLNEFLKEHRKIQQQEATMTQLTSTVAMQEAAIAQQQKDFQSAVAQQQKETKALVARLDEQASQIWRVSKQLAAASPFDGGLQVSGPAPKVASNHVTNTDLQ